MSEPAYMRVYHSIRSQIMDKKYDVGAILPPEPELEKAFGVSRTTIRRAIEMLAREGVLSVRQGFGTQVVSRKAVQNLNEFTSISESLAQKGHKIGLRSCFIEKVGASEKIANLLGVQPRTPLICVHRIRTSDGFPISISKNFILEQLVPGIDAHTRISHLYDYLKEKYVFHILVHEIPSAPVAQHLNRRSFWRSNRKQRCFMYSEFVIWAADLVKWTS